MGRATLDSCPTQPRSTPCFATSSPSTGPPSCAPGSRGSATRSTSSSRHPAPGPYAPEAPPRPRWPPVTVRWRSTSTSPSPTRRRSPRSPGAWAMSSSGSWPCATPPTSAAPPSTTTPSPTPPPPPRRWPSSTPSTTAGRRSRLAGRGGAAAPGRTRGGPVVVGVLCRARPAHQPRVHPPPGRGLPAARPLPAHALRVRLPDIRRRARPARSPPARSWPGRRWASASHRAGSSCRTPTPWARWAAPTS